uniref:Sulfotransferase n=1 Tax=Gopherus agassizii TaxID=38772 RepID=A0A452HS11_9SAUR
FGWVPPQGPWRSRIKDMLQMGPWGGENIYEVVSGPLTLSSLGTNWMLEILSLIRSDGDPGWVCSVLNWDRVPWVEYGPGLEAARKYPPPRLLCFHLPVQLFPKSLQRSKAKIIYTLRCPKDVVVSLYHFSRIVRLFKDPDSLDCFLEDFLSGNVLYGSWFHHVTGWMGLKANKNIFSITYEELQQDLQGSVRRICHFLGKELSEEQVAAVVENVSFQSMKGNKISNFSQMSDKYMDHQKGEFLRKGICGDWRNHLSEAQSQRFDTVFREWMQGSRWQFSDQSPHGSSLPGSPCSMFPAASPNRGSPSPAPQASGRPSLLPAQAGFLLFAHTVRLEGDALAPAWPMAG